MIWITIGSIFQYLAGHSFISIQLFIPSTNRRICTPLSAASCSAPKINFPLSSDWNAKVERIISSFAFLINALFVKVLLDSFLWLLPVLYFHFIRSMTHFLFLFWLYWTLPAAFYMQRRFRAIHKKPHIKNCQYNKKDFIY